MCMVSPDPAAKRLIVNADDLGYDPEIDRGILEGHARGLVTSATAMVDTPFASTALRAAPASLRLGLHAVLDPALPRAQAEAELLRQIARFAAVAAAHRLPVRALDEGMRSALRGAGVRTTDHFLGDADLRPCWTKERLAGALAALEDGTTELMCHPGHAPSHARTSFGAEREVELLALCDRAAREAVARAGAVL